MNIHGVRVFCGETLSIRDLEEGRRDEMISARIGRNIAGNIGNGRSSTLQISFLGSWESKDNPPNARPPGNKALLGDYRGNIKGS